MNQRAPLPPIRFAELADALRASAERLVPDWLPDGKREGHEWRCANLRGGEGTSCAINLTTGQWADFATDEKGGDLISLYAAIHGMTMGKAAVAVARAYGLETVAGVTAESAHHQAPAHAGSSPAAAPRPAPAPGPAASTRESWQAVTPVPDGVPAPTFRHWKRAAEDITHTATYRRDGQLYGYVVRFRTSAGGKDVLPYTWCRSDRDGGMMWRWKQWQPGRPLYLPGGTLPAGRKVVLVEGEKKADVLQHLLDAAAPAQYCVASWPGGCKAWKMADWSWLAGSRVLLWPDCDAKRVRLTAAERNACATPAALAQAQAAKPLQPATKQPGMRAMVGIGQLLQAEHDCTVQLLPIPEPGAVVDGWDCDDAITADGWDGDRVLAFFDRSRPLQAAGDDPAGAAPAGQGADADRRMPDWLRPYWDPDKRKWRVSRKLVITALRKDPALAGMLAYNELACSVDVRRQPPWAHGAVGPIRNGFDLALATHLSDTYGLPSINRQAVSEAVEAVANEQSYHPVRDWLRAQIWDGKPRLDKWLIYVLGLQPTDITPALAEYFRQVGRYWLLGMVYRVMEPGCQFDYCPVLEGHGGLRKSTLVKVLTSTQWFSATHIDLQRGRDGEEQLRGLWGYEFAEMAGMSKTDVRLIKSFISRTEDRYRPAYGRVLEAYPRQVVLMGTTNDKQYLRDRTGNRRFWPVPVKHVINVDWVARMRGQLFAEAVQAYEAGERYFPTPEDEDRLFVPMQESRVAETAISSELLYVLTRPSGVSGIDAEVNGLAPHVTLSQLVRALGLDPGKSNAGVEQEIRSWLNQERWEYKRKRVGPDGTRARVYVRPANWPDRDQEDIDMEAEPDPPAAAHDPYDPFEDEADDAVF